MKPHPLFAFVALFPLSACMSASDYSYGGSGAVLTTTGTTHPAFIPGRADSDRFGIYRELRKVDESADCKGGKLPKRDRRSIRHQSAELAVLADEYGADGYTASELRELESRTRALQDQAEIQCLKKAQ
ncbi:MAG: hypothetical protein AAGK02_09945 [Pseudomonadota bacterium]